MRRMTTGLVLLGLALAAEAGDAPAPKSHDEQVLDYVSTYAPIDADVRRRVADLAGTDDPAAAAKLAEMGEPARRVLASLIASRPKIEKRVAPVLDRLKPLHAEVARRGLDHDVGWLCAAGPAGAERIDRILPKEAPRKDAAAWWMLHGRAYRWEPTADRFVPAAGTPAGAASLRLRDRARVRLAETANLVSPASAFTLEMWWRSADAATEIYLAGDEAWPDLNPDKIRVDTKCGWVLRRIPDGKGASYLQFCAAVAPNDWWAISSVPVVPTAQWEHLALVSTGDAVRIYRDGECVAAGRCDDRKFLRSPTDICAGPREDTRDDPRWANRVAHHDLKGLRLSEGARWKDDFTPPAVLEKDGATLALLEFTEGATRLRDASGHNRDGVNLGGTWVAAIDPADVRQVFRTFGAALGEMTVVEAESGAASADWWVAERDAMSDGSIFEICSDRDADALGHWAKVPFRVEKAGAYRLWYAGGSLERRIGQTPDDYSPFSWRVDDAAPRRVAGSVPSAAGMRNNHGGLAALGVVDLAPGEHAFELRLLSRRTTDNRWSLWFDGIVLERIE